MNPKEIIEKLRLTFSELTGNATIEPVSLAKATLKDGTEVDVTELAVGGIVTINGSPAPTGEHELSDGSIIVVGENGVIMEIKPAETPAVEVEVETKKDDMNTKFAAFETATNERFASYEAKFAEYESKLAKANQVIEGLLNLTQTLAETPTGSVDASIKATNSFQDEPKAKSYDILFS